jgi:hypothetical protein
MTMKNLGFLAGSSTGMAAVAKLDTTVGFLADRRQATAVSPVGKATTAGYVWRRVFLRGKTTPR